MDVPICTPMMIWRLLVLYSETNSLYLSSRVLILWKLMLMQSLKSNEVPVSWLTAKSRLRGLCT